MPAAYRDYCSIKFDAVDHSGIGSDEIIAEKIHFSVLARTTKKKAFKFKYHEFSLIII